MNLHGYFEKIPSSHILIETPSAQLQAGDLSGQNVPLMGHSILIASDNLIEALLVMASFDGSARQIGFCSPSLTDDEIDIIAQNGEFEVVLGRGAGALPRFETCREVIQYLSPITPAPWAGETAWVMTTSGTTGTPKLVSHSLASLTKTTKISDTPQTAHRWGLLYDFTRFAGMQVVLQSLLSGAYMAVPDPHGSLREKTAFLIEKKVGSISATPTMWRNIIMSPEHKDINLRVATLGGEIADQSILDALRGAYPKCHIVHIFASTEAGVGFSVKDCLAGFPVDFLENADIGANLRVVEGMLEVQNQNVGKTYLGTDKAISNAEGWVSTGDLVEIRGDRVHFLGRANGTINVGGNKVIPETVEAAIAEHSMVLLSRVGARKNPFSGALVAAEVVLREPVEDEKAFKQELRLFLQQSLENFQVPASVKIVDKIETNSAGKVIRRL